MLARLTPPTTSAITALGPAPGEVIVERPAPGLARGKYAWPAWAITLLGAGVIVVALGYLLIRLRRGRRR